MRRTATLALLLGVAVATTAAADKEPGTRKPPEGAVALFNGKDLTGWADPDEGAKDWKVEDGVLRYFGKGFNPLITAKKYKDFELWADWKIAKGSRGSIHLRGRPSVGIQDHKEGSGGLWGNPSGSPGSVPRVAADNKPGEWNTFHIKLAGGKVTVKLNGKLVVENAPVQGEFGFPEAGPISLYTRQGMPLWFRNIYLREIQK